MQTLTYTIYKGEQIISQERDKEQMPWNSSII